MVGMFDESSRYFNLKDLTYKAKLERGKEQMIIKFKERRFIPIVKQINILKKLEVVAGDRPDTIASQTIGDPEQFWRICDTNENMHPLELTRDPGKIINIGLPQIDL